MKITIVSRGDASSGGAGRIAEILATGLESQGNDVCHLIKKRPRPDYADKCKQIPSTKGDVLLRNAIGLDISGLLLLAHPDIRNADIVHFHDFSVAFGSVAALIIAKYKRVFFTLHDFSGLTGGCMNPKDCNRYLSGCGKCPQIGSPPLTLPLDITKHYFKLHKKIAENKNVVAISPSKYLQCEAMKGAWKNGKVEVIKNAVEINLFNSDFRDKGRRRLELDEKHKALLFVSIKIMNPNKGFVDLEQAFLTLADKHPEIILVLAGESDQLSKKLQPYKNRIRQLGTIKDSKEMAEIFAACDCCVSPTRGDNFPCTILESLSTGTPVIAYRVGGIPEMYQSPEQGYMVAPNDREGLTNAIRQFLKMKTKEFQRQEIRGKVIERFSTGQFIRKHLELYSEFTIDST